MFKLALAALLRLTTPTPHLYTAADLAANLPYTSADLASNLPYTSRDWESSQASPACQCIALKISPDGRMVVGLSRPCSCDE